MASLTSINSGYYCYIPQDTHTCTCMYGSHCLHVCIMQLPVAMIIETAAMQLPCQRVSFDNSY